MDVPFLSGLRSRIEWRSWYRAALAALAASLLAFSSFSEWAVALAAVLYCAAFFWGRRAREYGLSISFWLFALLLALGSFVIGRETDFFGYLGALQSLSIALAFLVFFLILASSSSPKKLPLAEAFVHTALLLFWTVLSGMLLDRWGAWWFIGFFAVVAFLARESIERSLMERSARTIGFALFSGLLASELLFLLRFLPFHLIPQAILVSVALIVFFDVVRAHVKGLMPRHFVVEKAVTFLFFLLLLAFFSKWTL